MEIGPIREGTTASGEQVKQEKSGDAAEIAEKQSDNVEISAEARRFSAREGRQEKTTATEGNEAEDNTLHHQNRMDQIRVRIESGYYDQDVVRDVTVEKMIDDMLEDINSFYK